MRGACITAPSTMPIPRCLNVPFSIAARGMLLTTPATKSVEAAGLMVVDLDLERVTRAFELRTIFPALSAEDCFSLSLAEKTNECILLTGDAGLRKAAGGCKIEVHGLIWVIDELQRLQIAPAKTLVSCLESWRDDRLVRLPPALIAARIRLLAKM